MNCPHKTIALLLGLHLSLLLVPAAGEEGLPAGSKFRVGGFEATITRLEMLPFIQNDYSRLFHFESAENAKLKELRERYDLDAVVAPGKDEFARQLLLMNWVHTRFRKFGQPSAPARGALEILSAIERGHTFFCAQYAQLMVSAAASLGWVDRELALRRHQGTARNGSSEHSTTEIWSNQFGKWIMLDPTANMHLEKQGVPLNAWEIRQEWFYNDGRDLDFVIGKDRQKYRKRDLPVRLAHFAGFGDLSVDPDELDKYGFIGYIPNTNLMDAREDYANMFIVQDALCAGTRWHTRKNPGNPAVEAYFPIGQAALKLGTANDDLRVSIHTLTPNLDHFEARVDEAEWKRSDAEFHWPLHPGRNILQVRTVNALGIFGPVSTAEVRLENE